MYHVRRAAADEWAAWVTIVPAALAGEPEAARERTADELLQLGVRVLSVEADGAVWFDVGLLRDPAPGEYPGVAKTSPTATPQAARIDERYAAIVPSQRDAVLMAEVRRTVEGEEAAVLTIPAEAIETGDEVLRSNVVPHAWCGEEPS
jgi:hypothetical protein